MQKVKVGITIGDINGIGPEVIIKALADTNILESCVPIIYGSSKVMAYHKNIVKTVDFSFNSTYEVSKLSYNKINVLNSWNDNVEDFSHKPSKR